MHIWLINVKGGKRHGCILRIFWCIWVSNATASNQNWENALMFKLMFSCIAGVAFEPWGELVFKTEYHIYEWLRYLMLSTLRMWQSYSHLTVNDLDIDFLCSSRSLFVYFVRYGVLSCNFVFLIFVHFLYNFVWFYFSFVMVTCSL